LTEDAGCSTACRAYREVARRRRALQAFFSCFGLTLESKTGKKLLQ
jgi:hypothetical protein